MSIHVLVPVDESEQSNAALKFTLSEYPDAQITALHIIDPGDFYGAVALEAAAPTTYHELHAQQEEAAEQIIANAEEQANTQGSTIETETMIGDVAHSIVEYADGHTTDHIILGSHGRTGTSRVLLGSVAEQVARRSPVPVTIIR